MNRKQKKMLARILTAAAMLIALKLIPVTGVLQLALYLVAYLVIGYDILKKAWRGILNRQVFDENFLMAVATVGAFALAIVSRSGDYVEAIAVMLFYQIGELFQSYAVGLAGGFFHQVGAVGAVHFDLIALFHVGDSFSFHTNSC